MKVSQGDWPVSVYMCNEEGILKQYDRETLSDRERQCTVYVRPHTRFWAYLVQRKDSIHKQTFHSEKFDRSCRQGNAIDRMLSLRSLESSEKGRALREMIAGQLKTDHVLSGCFVQQPSRVPGLYQIRIGAGLSPAKEDYSFKFCYKDLARMPTQRTAVQADTGTLDKGKRKRQEESFSDEETYSRYTPSTAATNKSSRFSPTYLFSPSVHLKRTHSRSISPSPELRPGKRCRQKSDTHFTGFDGGTPLSSDCC